jgi:hypothetical protein
MLQVVGEEEVAMDDILLGIPALEPVWGDGFLHPGPCGDLRDELIKRLDPNSEIYLHPEEIDPGLQYNIKPLVIQVPRDLEAWIHWHFPGNPVADGLLAELNASAQEIAWVCGPIQDLDGGAMARKAFARIQDRILSDPLVDKATLACTGVHSRPESVAVSKPDPFHGSGATAADAPHYSTHYEDY